MDVAPMNGDFKCYTENHSVKYTIDPNWACKMLEVGIPERTRSAMAVKPNPATSFIEVNLLSDGNVTLYNLNGQLLRSVTLSAGTQQINCEDLQRGIYIVEMKTGTAIKRSKLILQ
jgi:hypothetical protein